MESFSTLSLVWALSAIGTIAAVVLLYVAILPESKRKFLPPIGKFVADFFNFKELYLEKVLRFTYVLGTVACIVTGVMMIFGVTHFESRYYSNTTWYGFYGIGLAIGGTIALRLAYEGIMMALLLVRNVMEINSKLKAPKDPEQSEESTEE